MPKRVLVVEDNPKWRGALCDLYESVLRQDGHEPEVTPAPNGQDARRLLRAAEQAKRPYDLLSLDINLGRLVETKSFDDGRDVLSLAYTLKAARSVIIVTGVAQDKEIDLLVTDSREKFKIRSNLSSHLARLFPNDRHHYVFKSNLDDPDEEVRQHLEGDFRASVLRLSRSPNRFRYDKSLGTEGSWLISYADSAEVSMPDDTPGALRAIALLLQRPNPEVEFNYAELFVPEGDGAPLLSQEELREASLISFSDSISDPKRDAECIERLEKLDEEIERLEAAEADAESSPILSASEAERIGDELEALRWEKRMILKDGFKYNKKRKKYVAFRNTFPRPEKKVLDTFKKRIKRALVKIGKRHKECGEHLSKYISVKGNTIAYKPRQPVDWDVTIS